MWETRVQPVVCVHSCRPWRGCPPLSTGNPPDVHRTCPLPWGQRRNATDSFSPEPSTAHPHASTGRGQPDDSRYLSTSISPGLVHICAERPEACPPLGINPWGRPVDNLGTPCDRTLPDLGLVVALLPLAG